MPLVMLRVLLAKDLRRAMRNPLPWLINLIVPLAMTALIGMVFGGGSENGGLGKIRFAVVDEDQSVLTDFLRGAMNQGKGNEHLEPVFMEREAALKLINANKISAVLIIETNFMRNYLTAREPVSLELIKNPAESIHPAVLEELLGAVVTALNGISRNFNSEFPEWRKVFEGKEDYHKVSFLIERAGDKLKTAKQFINPPLVGYEKDEPAAETNPSNTRGDAAQTSNAATGHRKSDTNQSLLTSAGTNQVAAKAVEKKIAKSNGNGLSGIFGYLLVGLSAMFLLFLGQNAMTDLHRELRKRTFERYQTLHEQLWPFIMSKIIFAVVMLLLCSAVMLGGGGLVFGIHWENPFALFCLVLGYSCFVAGLFAVLVALVPDERRAAVLNNITGMALGLVGGGAFPPESLPAFLREHVTPLLPTYWFANTARNLQFGSSDVAWALVLLKLAVCSAVLTAVAALLFRRKFSRGIRA